MKKSKEFRDEKRLLRIKLFSRRSKKLTKMKKRKSKISSRKEHDKEQQSRGALSLSRELNYSNKRRRICLLLKRSLNNC